MYRVRSVSPVNIRGERQFSLSFYRGDLGLVGGLDYQPGDEQWSHKTPRCSPIGGASICELRIYNPTRFRGV